MLSTQNFIPSKLSMLGFIIVEPAMFSADFYRVRGEVPDMVRSRLNVIAKARYTSWSSREAAFANMRRNFIWKTWDPRVLRTYVVSAQGIPRRVTSRLIFGHTGVRNEGSPCSGRRRHLYERGARAHRVRDPAAY